MPRPTSRNTRRRFITRMQDDLWRVWVQFRDLDLGQEYFSDAKLGGVKACLKAAIERRDALVKEHKIPLRCYDGNGWCAKDKRNTSGEVGIGLFLDDPEAPTRVSWGARIMVDGAQRNVTRSIRKFGYRGAWRAVAKIRARHTGQPVAQEPPTPPDWLVKWASDRDLDLAK